MSLRRRLLLVVVLAAVALGAAALAISHALASTDAARLRGSENALAAAVDTMAEGRSVDPPLADSALGTCSSDGSLVALAANGKHAERDPHPKLPPPDQRDAVAMACRAATADGATSRVVHPHDVVLIHVRRLAPDRAAWAIARIPTPDDEGASRWKIDLALLSFATLALVAVTLSAVVALGGGMRDLEGSLQRLQHDLRAPLARARTSEFARVTAGLQEMATHLAEAHAREGALTKDLAHRDRLSALGRVVAGVAHEIRNPLAGIKLKLDVLERSKDIAPTVKADVRSCLDEVGRLDRVVQSLLLVARKSKTEDTAIDLASLVDERARLLEGLAREREVVVRREGAAVVTADRDGLARAFDNLLRNALEASPRATEVTVEISMAEDVALVRVIDHGPGIERSGELFEPFFTTKPDGTGLGLWLTRSILEAHGGELSYAREGDSTTFLVSLPRRAPRE